MVVIQAIYVHYTIKGLNDPHHKIPESQLMVLPNLQDWVYHLPEIFFSLQLLFYPRVNVFGHNPPNILWIFIPIDAVQSLHTTSNNSTHLFLKTFAIKYIDTAPIVLRQVPFH